MTRVWILLFVMSLSTTFLIYRPSGTVSIPVPVQIEVNGDLQTFDRIPADTFWYHSYDHVGKILTAVVILSLAMWPSERQRSAYVLLVAIEAMDFILYRIYYRDWGLPVPWNVTKTIIFGIQTIYLQWKETSLSR